MVNESPYMSSHLLQQQVIFPYKHNNYPSHKNTKYMVITSQFEAILRYLEIPDLKEVNKSPEVISLLKSLMSLL